MTDTVKLFSNGNLTNDFYRKPFGKRIKWTIFVIGAGTNNLNTTYYMTSRALKSYKDLCMHQMVGLRKYKVEGQGINNLVVIQKVT